MTDFTVKKADHTTDIVWAQTQVGGSDATKPAIWQSTTVGTAVAHRPELRYYVKGSGTKKTVVVTVVYPSLSTDSTTGITSIIKRQRFKGTYDLDQEATQADIDQFVTQCNHLLAHATLEGHMQVARGNVT